MHKLYELVYAIVGERLSLAMFKSALSGWFSKPRGFTSGKLERDPLVMLLLGCPGHGKTYISRNAAKALVGDDNYKEVACGSGTMLTSLDRNLVVLHKARTHPKEN